MLEKWLKKDHIQIIDSVSDWKEAIRICGIPLIKHNIIAERYINAIYDAHKTSGPYYVLKKGIAMPHARPEQGAYEIGLSLLIINSGVNFNSEGNDPIYMVILLSSKNNDSHTEIITSLGELLFSEDVVDDLIQSKSSEEVYEIVKHY